MSGLLTSSEISGLASDLDSVFSTFSNNRNIVVWKQPIKVVPSTQVVGGSFGFGGVDVEPQQETYIPVSGVFPAVIRYASPKHIGQTLTLDDTNLMVPVGEVKIKVRPDCYAFIESGATDKISFDNRDWFFAGKAQAYPFMGGLYYMYQLKPKE